MPNVLFLVHGMGDHLPGWSAPHVDLLNSLLATFPIGRGSATPFTDRVHVEEITYDAVFDHHVLTWGQQVAALEQFGIEHGIALPRTLTLLSGGTLSFDAKKFVWETLLDPVLYRGARIVRHNVRAVVIQQVLEKWDWYLKQSSRETDPVHLSFLCHSLGTIVTSDVLAHLGEARDPSAQPFSAAKQRIHLLCTLANVTQLGPKGLIDIDSLKTVVRPTSAPKVGQFPRNYLSQFLNVRHRYDPFCWWQRFDPTDWRRGYTLLEDIDHLHFAFPHDFLHYLKHPAVHVALFRGLLGHDAISATAEAKALRDFQRILVPGACGVAVTTLEQRYQALAATVGAGDSLDSVVAHGIEVYEAARAAQASCAQLPFGGADT